MAGQHQYKPSDDYSPSEYYENPLHPSMLSRGVSFRENVASPRLRPPASYGLDLPMEAGIGGGGGGGIYAQSHSHSAASISSSQMGSPRRGAGGDEIVKKLVRLNTSLRHQMELEGWAPATDTDGVLTEEELLEAARAQGVLKRKSAAWKWTAIAILALVAASFGIMLGLVIIGGLITRDVRTERHGLMTTASSGEIVSNVRAEESARLVNWADKDPMELIHLNRVLLTANDGTVLNEQIAIVVADYEHNELFLKVSTGGWIWIANETIQAVNLNYYQWKDGYMQWKGNPSHMGLGAHGRRLQQIGKENELKPIEFKGHGVLRTPSATASINALKYCKGRHTHICGIPGCPACKK